MTASDSGERFREGQVWTYATRPGEEGSTLLINRIDDHPDFGRVFHLSLRELRVRSDNSPGGFATTMSHCPVSLETMEASAVDCIGDEPADPDHAEGYEQWRRAVDEEGAGVWTLPVAEIVDTMEQAING